MQSINNSINENDETELNYAIKINKEGFFPGRIECKYGAMFYIQYNKSNKTFCICFGCTNNH